MKQAQPTLLFQQLHWWLILLTFKQVVGAKRIAWLPVRDLSGSHPLPGMQRWSARWLRWLNPQAEIGEVAGDETYLSLWLENNAQSDQAMDRLFERVTPTASLRSMSRWFDAEGLSRYVKISLLPWVLNETFFYRMAHHLQKAHPSLILLPASYDRYGFHEIVFDAHSFRRSVPAQVQGALWILHHFRNLLRMLSVSNLWRVLLFSLQPLLQLVLERRVHRVIESQQVDVVTPLINGFPTHKSTQWALRSDDYLLGGALIPSRVGFYESDWKRTATQRAQDRATLEQRHAIYLDPDQFTADPSWCWMVLRFCASFVIHAGPGLVVEEPRVCQVSSRLARQFLQEELFARNVQFKVSLEHQDYAARHVVRTLVANRHGRLTLGMHHGNLAAPWVMPQLRYTYVNRQCVWGPAFMRMYQAHWSPMRCIPIGAYRIDAVIAAKQPNNRTLTWRRLKSVHQEIRPLILLLMPSLSWYIMPSKVKAFLRGLSALRPLPGTFRIVCRFREATQRQQWLDAGMRDILRQDPRITEDLTPGTTAEWMALSDFVIASSHSTAILEAAGADIPCAAFDFMLTADRVFGRFGPWRVLKTDTDLIRLVQALQSGQSVAGPGLRALAEDYSYSIDGHNLDRYRGAILEAIRHVEGSVQSPRRDTQPMLTPRSLVHSS